MAGNKICIGAPCLKQEKNGWKSVLKQAIGGKCGGALPRT
jgi:hypothetical protein